MHLIRSSVNNGNLVQLSLLTIAVETQILFGGDGSVRPRVSSAFLHIGM